MSPRSDIRRAADDWRAASAIVAAREARTVAQGDRMVAAIVRGVAYLLLILAGVWLLALYAEPCAAGTLCMAVVGMPRRVRNADDAPETIPAPPPPRPAVPRLAAEQSLAKLLAAHHALADTRERNAYTAGFRWGWVSGACTAGIVTALVMAAAGFYGFRL